MDDGIAALGGYGRIFQKARPRLSGRVPQISIITGVSAGGGAYSPALTDFVVMTEQSAMFLTGPGVVKEVMGEDVDAVELGGPRVHSKNGVRSSWPRTTWTPPGRHATCSLTFRRRPATTCRTAAPRWCRRWILNLRPGVATLGVRRARRDRGRGGRRAILEMPERWARNMVTVFRCIDGRPVGVIANQPWYWEVIDADASQKAAKFVRICNSTGCRSWCWSTRPATCPGPSRRASA